MLKRLAICFCFLALPFSAAAESLCAKSATMSEAKALAARAADHLAKAGLETAFRDFFDPKAGFRRDDLYVFVFRRDGLLLLNVGFPELIGSNLLGDPNAGAGGGWPAARDALRLTRGDGAGWIAYDWYNPCTGRIGAKQSYVIGRGNLIIGVGAYGTLLSV